MGDLSVSFEEISKRVKIHKDKEYEWCLKRDKYIKQISILMGQNAAYNLCLSTLTKQIEDVKNMAMNYLSLTESKSTFTIL